jgi:3-phosphoshikimate 1-carboxyvinyltransferase
MHLLTRQTTTLAGKTTPPSSKSQTIRGLVFALLAQGKSTLNNVLDSDDAEDAINACQQLGAKITRSNNQIIVDSTGLPLQTNSTTLYTGNSGITTRFITPLLGYRQHAAQPLLLNCGEQMRARPIRPLVDALRNLGMTIEYREQQNVCPLAISGTLMGGSTTVDGLSSQYLSALLIALPCAEKSSQITVQNLHERPYIEMTLQWLDAQNIRYTHEKNGDTDLFHIAGQARYQPFEKTISGDFSSASCLIVAAALTQGTVEFTGLDMQDPQGDKRLISILQSMGADITIASTHLTVCGGKPLTGLKIDANDIPDLLPALAVLGTQATGKTDIYNVKQARIKETDRIHSMTEGLKRMGARLEEQADGMVVYQSKLHGASVRGYNDHRTVMSLGVAGLFATGDTRIDDANAIQKTFPTFVEIMCSLGANMELQREIA